MNTTSMMVVVAAMVTPVTIVVMMVAAMSIVVMMVMAAAATVFVMAASTCFGRWSHDNEGGDHQDEESDEFFHGKFSGLSWDGVLGNWGDQGRALFSPTGGVWFLFDINVNFFS